MTSGRAPSALPKSSWNTKAIEGATLVILHAPQAAFGHVPKSVLMMPEALKRSRKWRDEQWLP
jgi:hypothetical protein